MEAYKMSKKVTFSFKLIAKSKLHVGCGLLPELPTSPKPVFRRYSHADGVRVEITIPGSTLKGILRHIADKFSDTLGYSSCKSVQPEEMSKLKNCDVCNLFGRPGGTYPRLIVYDSISNISEEYLIEVTGTLIDRKSGTVMQKHLYSYEVIPPGTVFEAKIVGWDFTEKDYLILLNALFNLQYEGIGGGRGQVIVKDLKVEPETEAAKKVIEQFGGMFQ